MEDELATQQKYKHKMPQVSSKVKSGRQTNSSSGRKGGGRPRTAGDAESQPIKNKDSSKDQDIGLPRLVARIWGLVSGICK